jgi:hypothetical protein
MSVILSAAKRSRRTPDRLLKSPHPTLLPQGEGTAGSRNDRDLRRTSLPAFSLPLGETHAQAAVRAVFRQSGGRNLKDFAPRSLGPSRTGIFARDDE